MADVPDPSADYRRLVYPDARAGWYGSAGDTLRAGARAGFRVNDRLELLLRAGYDWHGRMDGLIPPHYVVSSVNVRF